MFKPVEKNKRTYELVIEQIHSLIAEGKLKPGDRLLPERELAAEFQLSRTSVREALRILEALDIVDVRMGDGTYIKKPTINGIITPLIMFLQEETDDHKNLLETRTLVESGIARLAAIRRTEEELTEIEAYAQQMKELTDFEELIHADISFHSCIIKAAKNPTLTSFVSLVSELMKHGIRKSRENLFKEPGENEISAQQHIDIFHAIRDQDPNRAYLAMYHHLEYSANKVVMFQNQRTDSK